jgi:lipopolysaccharide export system protein LptA
MRRTAMTDRALRSPGPSRGLRSRVARGGLFAVALVAAFGLALADEPPRVPPQQPRPKPAGADDVAPALPRRPALADTLTEGEGVWHVMGAQLRGSANGPVSVDSLVARHGELTIRALRGLWYPDQRRVVLNEEVRIEERDRTLQSRRGVYNRDTAVLELEDEVRGRGPEGRFSADRLRYDRRANWLRLTGLVRLFERDRSLRSQWLEYDLSDSFATAGDDVLLRDDIDSVEVSGPHLAYDRHAGEMTVTGNPQTRPRLVRMTGGSAPRMTVVADTLRLWTKTREGEALGWVAIEYGDAQGACDRARFRMREDRVLLEGMPLLRDRQGSISGDSMVVELRDGVADRLVVRGHARSEYMPAAHPGEAHFAVGDTLTAFMVDGAITSVVLSGRAQALYLPSREDRAGGVGLNWTKSQRIRLLLEGRGVGRVQFEGEVEGRYLLPRAGGSPDSGRGAAQSVAPRDSAAPAAVAPITRALGDSIPASWEENYPPSVLAAIRRACETGALEPPDTLLARLPFDPVETVAYSGKRIDFGVADDRIVIGGGARVTYKGMELRSEEITFQSPDRLVIASGQPKLLDRETEVDGTRMSYRIDSRVGLIYQGRSALDPGFYSGERIKRVSPTTLFVENGEFTSCDAAEPHYHFQAARMKIMPNQKVIARPVVLYLGHVPIMAIPFAVFPTRRGRHSGILIPEVEFGFDSQRGRFLKNVGYYWAASDYLDALGWMDYYELDPRLTWNARLRYRVRYLLDGQVEGSFTRQRGAYGGRKDRWLFRASHDQTLGEQWRLKVSGNFQSDKDYANDRDFGANVDDRINRQLRSQLSLSRSWSGASLALLADRTEYLDGCDGGGRRVSQSAPSLSFSLNSVPLGAKPDARGHGGRRAWLSSTYFRGGLRALSIYNRECDAPSETNQAAAIEFSLSDKRRLLGVLNITPSASVETAWIAKGPDGKNPAGAAWRAGLSAGTTLYGTFFPRLGPWEGLRHVVELSASYGYRPELARLKDFPSVGGITLRSAKSSSVSLSLTQRFHAKFRAGEKSIKRENLLVWTTSTAYDFLEREKARAAKREARPWSDFSHNLRLQPGRMLETDLAINHDAIRWRDEYSLSLRTALRLQGGAAASGGSGSQSETWSGYGGFGDPGAGGLTNSADQETGATGLTGPWQMTLSHVYSRSRQAAGVTERNSANVALGLGLTPAWRLQYGLYYDLTEKTVSSQSLTLVRDLHCWEAVLERRESGGRSTYYFRVSVKDLPDIKYERRGQ